MLIVNHPDAPGLPGLLQRSRRSTARRPRATPSCGATSSPRIEVFNDSDFEENREHSVADWFALLNAGKTYWATGSSDSHHERSSPVG